MTLLLESNIWLSSFTVLAIFRIVNALLVQTYFNPDEYWQSLEIAHYWIFDQGALTWEWKPEYALRSVLHPALFAPLFFLMKVLHIDSPSLIIYGPKILSGIFAAIGDYYFYKLNLRLFNSKKMAGMALLCLLCNWFYLYCITRSFSNSLETIILILALYHWPWENAVCGSHQKEGVKKRGSENSSYVSSVALLAVCFVIRPTSAIFTLFFGGTEIFLLFFRAKNISKGIELIKVVLVSGFVMACLMLVSDSLFYGKLTFIPANFVYFNFVKNVSAFYGTNSWHWYFTNGFLSMVNFFGLFALIGAIVLLQQPSLNLSMARFAPFGVLAVAWNLVILSFSVHKEFRFALPLIPIVMIYAAAGWNALREHQLANPSSLVSRFLSICIFGIFVLQFGAAGYLGLFHQRAPVQVMWALQHVESHANVYFLTPCHSTPFYAYLHRQDVHLNYLDCSPNFDDPLSIDEAERFKMDPLQFWKEKFEHKEQFPSHLVIFERHYQFLRELLSSNYFELNSFFHTPGERLYLLSYKLG